MVFKYFSWRHEPAAYGRISVIAISSIKYVDIYINESNLQKLAASRCRKIWIMILKIPERLVDTFYLQNCTELNNIKL